MSLNRAIGAIRDQLFSWARPKKIIPQHSELALLNKIKIAPFAVIIALNELMLVDAETVYAIDPNDNTSYLVNYNENNFPHLRSNMMSYCKSILSDASSLMYSSEVDSPDCIKNGVHGPSIDISVEMGKVVTTNFISCMNQVMKKVCDEYYDTPGGIPNADHMSDRTIAIVLGCMAGIIAVCCCVYACKRRQNNELMVVDQPPPYRSFPAPTVYSQGSTARVLPVVVSQPSYMYGSVMMPPTTIIDINDSYGRHHHPSYPSHHPVDHHVHDDVSVGWNHHNSSAPVQQQNYPSHSTHTQHDNSNAAVSVGWGHHSSNEPGQDVQSHSTHHEPSNEGVSVGWSHH